MLPAPASEFPRQFVDPQANFGDWANAEGYYDELISRPVRTRDELESWLYQASELEACIDEVRATRYVESTCHTDDPQHQQRYTEFLERVDAPQKRSRDRLLRRFLEHADRIALPTKRFEVLLRSARNAIELFRDANVPLLTEDKKLAAEYQRLTGGMTVKFDGREQTLAQIGRYLEEPDGAQREAAWRAGSQRFQEDAADLDDLFVRMVRLRHEIARHADCRDFREYMWKRYERFDYSTEDCLRFHQAIAQDVVPAVRRFAAERRRKLELKTLRPWDFTVDPDRRPPLRPFQNEADLIAGCTQVFERVHADLGAVFDTLRQRGLLDLGSRKGKAPGGYQETFQERRVPFIFMNAVGTESDVRTLLHEGGHAFHTWACRHEPLLAYRSSEGMIEFAEVASMGMECLSLPHTRIFFGEAQDRATRRFFERIIAFFPYMARVDAFQHYVYTHPEAGLEAWKDEWQRLTNHFSPEVDYRGLEAFDRQSWQRKLHIYEVPFYYVEYGIAQLGALQVWLNSQRDYDSAVALYRQGLALGSSRPLPELFEAAGCKFDFSAETLRPLVEAVSKEIGPA